MNRLLSKLVVENYVCDFDDTVVINEIPVAYLTIGSKTTK